MIIFCILALSIWCVSAMCYQLKKQPHVVISFQERLKLVFSGIVAFISDTIGVGSFAVNIALAKSLNTFRDEELPAMNNGAQVIPGTIESLLFMQVIQVDWVTLGTLVLGTCIGGVLGGHVVARLSQQAIRLSMMCCFALIVSLLLSNELHLLPMGGELTALEGYKLWIGFFAMIVCGSLTTVGIGLFAMVQGVLFVLGMSPAIAFPIMTTAGAMQQPLSTLMFLKQDKIPLKKTFILSLAGIIGVFIATPIVSHLSSSWLHRLLIGIMLYNFISIGRAYLQSKSSNAVNPVMA
jgi:uncharacterized membrane protein YfcA